MKILVHNIQREFNILNMLNPNTCFLYIYENLESLKGGWFVRRAGISSIQHKIKRERKNDT